MDNTPPNPNQTPGGFPSTPASQDASQNNTNTFIPQTNAAPEPTVPNLPPIVNESKKSKKIKLPVLLALVLALILGGSAAAYFGYVLPNKPENVWASALKNTNEGYKKLSEYAEKNQSSKSYTLDGAYKVTSGTTVVDGKISSKASDKSSETKIDAGAAGARIDLNIITQITEASVYPDVYIKASGLKGIDAMFGAESAGFGQMLAAYDNQWYSIDHTLFDSYSAAATDGGTLASSYTNEDIIAINNAFSEVLGSHVLTDDPSKSIFSVSKFVGKEEVDSRNMFHYQVKLDKANAKAFAAELKAKMQSTKLKDIINDELVKDWTEAIDGMKDDETADVWVDGTTKLMRKIRVYDETDKSNYAEIALNYNGGDEYPFVITTIDGPVESRSTVNLGYTLNTNDNTGKITLSADVKGSSPTKVTANLTMKPGDKAFTVAAPAGAKPYTEIFGGLFGESMSSGGLPEESSLECADAFESYANNPSIGLPAECETL